MSRFTESPLSPAVLMGYAGFDVPMLKAAAVALGRAARTRFAA